LALLLDWQRRRQALAARTELPPSVIVGDLIGEGVAQEAAVVGEMPNLAPDCRHWPNPAVRHCARHADAHCGLFNLPTRYYSFKGYSEPVRLAGRVGRVGRSRFEAMHGGRSRRSLAEHEIGLLFERFERARDGDGQVVLLSRACIGKRNRRHARSVWQVNIAWP
jgi:hypothetical protein